MDQTGMFLILTSSPYIALHAPIPRFRLIATPNTPSDTASQTHWRSGISFVDRQ